MIEYTRELQCRAPNLVTLRTKRGLASLADLARSALRLRPGRIWIGGARTRGARPPESLGTGHPADIGAIHESIGIKLLHAEWNRPPAADSLWLSIWLTGEAVSFNFDI
jgi:type IV secretion system protein TrbB